MGDTTETNTKVCLESCFYIGVVATEKSEMGHFPKYGHKLKKKETSIMNLYCKSTFI